MVKPTGATTIHATPVSTTAEAAPPVSAPSVATGQAVTERLRPADFERIYNACEGPLMAYAQRQVRPTETAEDIVHEAFRRFIGELAGPAGFVGNAKAWLYRTVHNLVIDHYRRSGRQHHSMQQIQQAMPAHGPTSEQPNLAATEQGLLARRLLARLTEREQQVVTLKIDEEMSYAEIAVIVETSEGNVGYILHHALKKLRRLMTEEGAA